MSLGGGSSGGGQAQNVTVQPYAPAQGSLNQIISEAGNIYGQGVSGAGYVAPLNKQKQDLLRQEALAGQANTQISNTLCW